MAVNKGTHATICLFSQSKEEQEDMADKKVKLAAICLSSEEEEEEDECSELDYEEMTSSQSCSDEGSDRNYEDEADLDSEDGDDYECSLESAKVLDNETCCDRVIRLLKGGSDLQELKVVECKEYLRKHGLKLTGNKAVCIQRIKEHWSDKGTNWNDEEKADLESEDKNGLELTNVLDIEACCNKVIHLLKGGSDLQELKVEECKAYLRKHGLRLTGNKAVCIQRTKEHWRINDGKGEISYPISSFVINCTGDVCTGDVVLFTQRVHERYDKVTRSGKLLGKRTIAGRVVKESYGAAKQQHTFTVEVFWSKGFKILPPLFPLLVKGRNLYRFRTFRQRWDNEEERSNVLNEKHRRGTEARCIRAMRTTRPANQGSKHRKQSNHARPPKREIQRKNQEFLPLFEKGKPERVTGARIPQPSFRNLENRVPNAQNGNPIPIHTQCWPQMQYQQPKDYHQFTGHENENNRGPSYVSNYKAGPASDAMRMAPFRDYTNQMRPPVLPTVRHQGYNQSNYGGFHGYPNGARNVNCFMGQGGSLHPQSMGAGRYGGRREEWVWRPRS